MFNRLEKIRQNLLTGEKIEKSEDIKPALQRAIESKKPAVIDVSIAFETPPPMRLLAQFKKNKGLFGK